MNFFIGVYNEEIADVIYKQFSARTQVYNLETPVNNILEFIFDTPINRQFITGLKRVNNLTTQKVKEVFTGAFISLYPQIFLDLMPPIEKPIVVLVKSKFLQYEIDFIKGNNGIIYENKEIDLDDLHKVVYPKIPKKILDLKFDGYDRIHESEIFEDSEYDYYIDVRIED